MSSPIKRRFTLFICVLFIVGGYFFVRWYQQGRFLEHTENAYLHAEISRISSEVSARIKTVHVRDNQQVKAGDVLMELEQEEFLIAKQRAEANLAMRQAELDQASAKLKQHDNLIAAEKAQVNANQASVERLGVDLKRAQALVKPGFIAEERLSTLNAEHKIARAQLTKADADLHAQQQSLAILNADVARLEALVRAAQSDVAKATLDLSRTTLYAPVDGMIGQRAARKGQWVQHGSYLLSIVPEHDIWVQANFKETQIERLHEGLKAALVFDSFPNTPIEGHIESLFAASGAQFSVLPPDNATGNFTKVVQRIPVKLTLEPTHALQGKLRPGMSVKVSVDTRGAQ